MENTIELNENHLAVQTNKSLVNSNVTMKVGETLQRISADRFLNVFSDAVQMQRIREEVISCIRADATYVARIPKKLQQGMDEGILKFMTDSKTGENLGVLVNEKHRIQGNVIIEKAVRTADIATNLGLIAVQQQLAQISTVVNDIRARVISIQEDMDDEILGTIKGMQNQLLQIRDSRDLATKKELLLLTINELNKCRGRIEKKLEKEALAFPDVPESVWGIVWEILKNHEYINNLTAQYDRIEKLTDNYLAATQLLGYAYAFLGEEKAYEDVFSISQVFFDSGFQYRLLKSETIYNETIGKTWYGNPDQFFLRLDQRVQFLMLDEGNCIELEIPGTRLLEALNDGNRE